MSKEWTINSFWIEEELKGFLSNHKEINESLLKGIQSEQSVLFEGDQVDVHVQNLLNMNNDNQFPKSTETLEDDKEAMTNVDLIEIIQFDSEEKLQNPVLRPIHLSILNLYIYVQSISV